MHCPSPPRSTSTLCLASLIITALLTAPAQAAGTLPPIAWTAAQIEAAGVRTHQLGAGAAQASAGMVLQGQVELPPQATELLSSPLAGVVQQVLVAPGQRVQAGQVLTRLTSPELLAWQRELLQAQSQARLAASKLARDEQLYAEGIIPGLRLSDSRTTSEQAQLALQERRQALQALGLAGGALQAQLRRGTLLQRYPGLADPADSLGADPDAWLVQAPLPNGAGADFSATWVQRILDDNHELERAQARAEQARLQAQRLQLERQPDATWGVRAARERGGQEQVLGVYLSLSLPLGSAGRAADAQAALAQADMAGHELAQTRQRVQADAWRTASEAAQAQATLERQHHALRQLEKSAALQERAYALGESPLVDLLLAQRGALDARLVTETAALDALQARARLLLDAHRLWTLPEQ